MDKSITYILKQKEYIRYTISRVFNLKIFFIYFILTFGFSIKLIVEKFSISCLISYIIIAIGASFALTLILTLWMILYGIYTYKKDKNTQMKTTMNFHEDYLEEITESTTFKLKYIEIKKIELLKTILIIYISPARVFIIPKSNDYNIKELYSELKKLKNKKTGYPPASLTLPLRQCRLSGC